MSDQGEASALAPCPFCGHSARVDASHTALGAGCGCNATYQVICSSSHCRASIELHRSVYDTDVERHADVARRWNRRRAFNLLEHLGRQRQWSERTFGPGFRSAGVVDHIRRELREIEADPTDLTEWIDVAILALDGAWRCGASPEQIVAALVAKQAKNEARTWPDWRTAPPDKAIEHVPEAGSEVETERNEAPGGDASADRPARGESAS